ncbi:MAG: LysR family transcriptional regulator [Anaerolineae bacterium]
MIDLQKLHVFHVVVQEGSFSAAAERLYITQSAVSQQIKTLESGIGRTLFDRGWHGVRLTPSGEILAETTRQIFDLLAKAEHELSADVEVTSGKLTLGATPGIGVYLVPNWVQEFRTEFPKITVALNTDVTGDIVDEVLAHRFEIGIIEGEVPDSTPMRLGVLVLAAVELQLVVGFKHPFWERQSVPLAELSNHSFIMREQGSQSRIWLERTLWRHGIEPVIGAEFDNFEAIKRAVASGTCMAVLPSYIFEREADQHLLHPVTVEGKPFMRELKLVWDREIPISPIARRFMTYLTRYYPAAGAFQPG